MSSVGSLSSSTSTSIRGYGGLASGLDRDELIKGMTIGTTNKITQQEQKKQQLQWKQEAVQSISSSMIDFHSKYTETLTSPTNLFSSMLWGRNKITTSGVNSKYVSVTGTASAADAITIMGVKQKAEDAKWSSSKEVSTATLDLHTVTTKDKYKRENLIGTSIDFKYGDSDYSIYLTNSDEYDYTNAKNIADAVNKLLEKQTTSKDQKLSTIIKADVDADGHFVLKDVGSGGNTLELTGGKALELLGLADSEGKIVNDGKFKDAAGNKIDLSNKENGMGKITDKVNFVEYTKGASLTFSYNGTSTTWKMPDNLKDTLGENPTNEETVKAIADSIQEQLNKTFGNGRIKVNGEGGKLSFKTTVPEGGTDTSSVFSITGGSATLVSDKRGALRNADDTKSVLHVGDTTRLNLSNEIAQSDLEGLRKVTSNGKSGFMLNETFIEVGENATYKDLIDAINKSGANVTVTYQEAADKFTFTSKEKGASGVIDFSENDADTLKALQNTFGLDFGDEINKDNITEIETDKDGNKIVEIQIGDNKERLMEHDVEGSSSMKVYTDAEGKEKYFIDENGKLYDCSNPGDPKAVFSSPASVRGQDAIVSVKYAGSAEIVNLRRDSNSFTVDGLTIGVKGTFGDYNKDTGELQNIAVDQAVEVDASVDVDKVYDTIKSFVDSYNSIVDMVNTQLTTKHEKDYDPLTSDQKSQLSDDEVEKWEAKAKEGLLYGDSDLRSLSMDLRVVVSGGLLEKFKDIGITVSSTYSDNGKLSIDESKLRGALQTDPESVQKLFTSEAGVDENNNQTFNGLATNLKSVMNKYVNTMGAMESKGILIRKAGSKSSALSLTQNTYYSQMKSIDEALEKLKAKLKTEQDRYISQFSTLETLIANMNSQSSYLSSMSGY